MSGPPLVERGWAGPRSSVVSPAGLEPVLRHGLPSKRAWVGPGPPLSARGPSFKSVAVRMLPPRLETLVMPVVLVTALVFAVTVPDDWILTIAEAAALS